MKIELTNGMVKSLKASGYGCLTLDAATFQGNIGTVIPAQNGAGILVLAVQDNENGTVSVVFGNGQKSGGKE